jgi:large subunit ribosomal protein L21
MFAVVKIGSSQYLVNPGQELLVDFQGKNGSKLTFDQVLLLVDDQAAVTIGKPLVPGIVVEADVIDNPKGEKVRIGKFKAKSRYRKVRGFRPTYTRIKVTNINLNSESVAIKPVVRAKRSKKLS